MGGTYLYTSDIWLPLASSFLLVALGLYSWRHRSIPAALPLAACLLFGMLWLLGIAFGVSAFPPATKLAWHKFQAIWQLPAATAMTCFALEYAYPGRWLTRRNLTLLALPPLLVLFLIITNDAQLMWSELRIAADGSLLRDFATPGAILVAYGLSLVLINIVALIWLFIHSPQHRWPVALMLPALATYLSQYEKRYGIRTTLSAPLAPLDGAIDPLAEMQLLRIIQEALTNARKHGQARSVCVTFAVDDGQAQVTVQDDGCGFDQEAVSDDPRNRVGLRVMHERAEEAGGALAVQSAVGEGTQVIVTVPLRAASR